MVPVGGAAEELPLHSSRPGAGRLRDRGGYLRDGIPGFVSRGGRRLYRRAAPGVQGRRPRIPVETEAAHPGHLREQGEPARVRALPCDLPLHGRRGQARRRGASAGRATHQGARSGRCEPALFPPPHHRDAVQHRDRERVQRNRGRPREARPLGRLPGDAGGRRTHQPRTPAASLERPRRDRGVALRCRVRTVPAAAVGS